MNRDELDTLWQQALHESVKAGEDFSRYRFADLVAAAEREACARVCDEEQRYWKRSEGRRDGAESCAKAIRARGKK